MVILVDTNVILDYLAEREGFVKTGMCLDVSC